MPPSAGVRALPGSGNGAEVARAGARVEHRLRPVSGLQGLPGGVLPCAAEQHRHGDRRRASRRPSSPAVTNSSRCSSRPPLPARVAKGAPQNEPHCYEPLRPGRPHAHARAPLTLTTTLAALALLSACAGGSGSPTTVNQVATAPTSSAADYTGPPPENADVQAFKLNFWQNVIPSNRCGGCHHAGGQSPHVRALRTM